jgi:hypothetical protein
MSKIIFLFAIIVLIGVSGNYAYSQEIGLSTFSETAQIMIDNKFSNKITKSITLSSSNTQEILFPNELEQKIRENERITAIILTNQNNCVLGVYDDSCIIINIERNFEDKGITAIQGSSRIIADKYIEEINQVFDTNAKFFQVYIHTSDSANQALDTSGIVSGTGTISAVYTMPMEDTESMYQKISSMLLSKSIREGGGFYDIAKSISKEENSKMTFSLMPENSRTILQLRVSQDEPIPDSSKIEEIMPIIKPLKLFNIEKIKKSDYLSSGNYPLNSIIQVVILSNNEKNISEIEGNVLPSKMIDGIKMPTELNNEGWIFDPQKGDVIQGKYIFGERVEIIDNKLEFILTENELPSSEIQNDNQQLDEMQVEEIIIVIIIAILSIGAAIFYLKGYKK